MNFDVVCNFIKHTKVIAYCQASYIFHIALPLV